MHQNHHPAFAALYDLLTGPAEKSLLTRERRALVEGLSGDLLDIGCGTGATFPLLRDLGRIQPDLRIHAVEPDPHMLQRARRRAHSLHLAVDFQKAPAEALPFANASFDAVLATLVLCTVADPAQSLFEMQRVLKPNGTLRFLEHVRADGAFGWWQDRLRPLWSVCGAGCQLNRRTGDAILAAGFTNVHWKVVRVPAPLFVVLSGQATRP